MIIVSVQPWLSARSFWGGEGRFEKTPAGISLPERHAGSPQPLSTSGLSLFCFQVGAGLSWERASWAGQGGLLP